MRRITLYVLAVSALTAFASTSFARTAAEPDRSMKNTAALTPFYCSVAHNVGKIGLAVSNDGTFGASLSVSGYSFDCFTGELLPFGEFPLGSRTTYLFGGALWIGAVVGTDTLVSTGADGWSQPGNEFHPDNFPYGDIIYRSTVDPKASERESAVSEQDYIAVYRDTCRNCSGVGFDAIDGHAHRPLNLEVTQSSYAWSLPPVEDFVIIDYSVKNIGSQRLSEVYLGLYADHDIYSLAMPGGNGAVDDISGLWTGTRQVPSQPGCEAGVDLDVVWSADNDGDLGQTVYSQVPHVTGASVLRLGGNQPDVSFNWYVSNGNPALDFGPMRRSNYRDFTTGGTGTPEGDRNKYYLLSNGDRDYDQIRTASIGADDSVWLPPSGGPARWWASGSDTRYVLSVGPIDLEPGQSAPFTVAFVAGENLHTSYQNFLNLPDNPDAYIAGLDFSDLTTNAVWAGWVYDNPGVDTDSDGYAGAYQMCGEDTVWYQGDGVPDFSASGLPVAPTFWVEPRQHALWVRWNGFASETTIDWATRQDEFQGYRAYLSTNGDPGGFSCVGSYDVEDYYRYYWDASIWDWVRSPFRFTIEETLCLCAPHGCTDANWHPTDYTRQAPYVMPEHPDSMFYFEPVLANAWRFGLETPFVKRYPMAPRPPYDRPSDVPLDSAGVYLTPDGYFKYYEYEFLIDDLLPGQEYRVVITSFECGSMLPDALPVETAIFGNAKAATPLGSSLCCHGRVGNADCDDTERVSMVDIVVLVDHLFIRGKPLCCVEESDVNQSGGVSPKPEDVTMADILKLVDYLYITGPDNMILPECP
jgi:hypothetical protein